MTITRLDDTSFAVVTDTVLADGSLRADHDMALDGHTLRSVERPGCIRVGGLMRVELGPKSYRAVIALAVGATYTAR